MILALTLFGIGLYLAAGGAGLLARVPWLDAIARGLIGGGDE